MIAKITTPKISVQHTLCIFCIYFIVLVLAAPSKLYADEFKLSYNSDWAPYSSGVGNTVQGILPSLLDEMSNVSAYGTN